MSNNNPALPAELQEQIKQEAIHYANVENGDRAKFPAGDPMHVFWDHSEEDFTAGATAYAPWKVKYDQLQQEMQQLKERAEKLRLALVMAEFALRRSYDVTQWPADGSSEQDSAIKIANEALASWKGDQTNNT